MTGEPQEPVLANTAAASRDGAVGPEHVAVITRAMNAIGRIAHLEPSEVAAAEAALAQAATLMAPHAVDKVATRLRAHLDPDGVAPLDPHPATDELHLCHRRDGSIAMTARIFGAADADAVREVFDALSAPAGPDDHRSLAQRQAEAFLELVELAAGRGGIATDTSDSDSSDSDTPDSETTHGDRVDAAASDVEPDDESGPSSWQPRSGPTRGRPILMITIDHERLLRGIGHGLLDSDRTVAATEARRLACDAGILPAVLGSRGQPLDVGRLSYTVPDGMRRALHLRDRGCAFPGCTRRPRRTHAHHLHHWCDGGETKIDNLLLLCRFHHQLVHHGDWTIHMRQGRPWFTPPAWIDPARTPRPGGSHPPDP